MSKEGSQAAVVEQKKKCYYGVQGYPQVEKKQRMEVISRL